MYYFTLTTKEDETMPSTLQKDDKELDDLRQKLSELISTSSVVKVSREALDLLEITEEEFLEAFEKEPDMERKGNIITAKDGEGIYTIKVTD
jgi:hypothetical protein